MHYNAEIRDQGGILPQHYIQRAWVAFQTFVLPVHGGRGDQLVKVSIEVPTNLSKKQKDALQAFESTLEDKNYSRRASFFDKLKDLFK